MSIRSLSSPSPGEDSFSLNLFRGNESTSLARLNTQETLYWQDMYELDEALSAVRERAFDCFIKEILIVNTIYDLEKGEVKENVFFGEDHYAFFSEKKARDQKAVAQRIRECIRGPSNIVFIFVGIVNESPTLNSVFHATLLVINKIKNTVEYYDPNGYEVLSSLLFDGIDILKKFLISTHSIGELKNFTFVSIEENNPKYGLQYYQSTFIGYKRRFFTEGFCQTWVFYIAALREKYVNDSPQSFKRKINTRIEELGLKKGKSAAAQDRALRTAQHFANYILKYLIHIEIPKSSSSYQKRKRSSSSSKSRSNSPKSKKPRQESPDPLDLACDEEFDLFDLY